MWKCPYTRSNAGLQYIYNAPSAPWTWPRPYGYSLLTSGGFGIKKEPDFDGALDDNLP